MTETRNPANAPEGVRRPGEGISSGRSRRSISGRPVLGISLLAFGSALLGLYGCGPRIVVSDAVTEASIEGAEVTYSSEMVKETRSTDASGRAALPSEQVGVLRIEAPGYETSEVGYRGSSLEWSLRPGEAPETPMDGALPEATEETEDNESPPTDPQAP
jgi:hypothetical protein